MRARAGIMGVSGQLFEVSASVGLRWLANFCNVGAPISSWSSLIPCMKQFTTVSERHAAYYLTGVLVALAVGDLCRLR